MVDSLKTVSLKQPAGDPSTAKTPSFGLLLVSLLGGIFCCFPQVRHAITPPLPRRSCCSPSTPLSATTNSSSHRDPIKYQLLQKWPTLFVDNPEEDLLKASQKFWERQWKKHGSCSNLSPFDYFSLALKFRDQLNPLVDLRREGVEPSGRSFTAKELQDAMPLAPKVKCNKKNEMPQLMENPVGACMQRKRFPEERISRNKAVNISPRAAKWRPYRSKGNAILINLGTIWVVVIARHRDLLKPHDLENISGRIKPACSNRKHKAHADEGKVRSET
ncbi:hypothetical protein RJ639_042985 [Escallonia herrerae]|uniref:Uncharacterized protein n=1 Tax=Escallonia herrerae TaxID=1293975 RepID=A0AA88WCY3_9ASTE|nr:hypothetical protein RJ639_042985 [Escallonia herrerae]